MLSVRSFPIFVCMKKAQVLFIFLFVSFTSFGQIEKEFAKVLATKDFRKVQPFCDNLPQNNYPQKGETINSNWAYLRDLAPGYKEGVFDITHYARNSDRHFFKIKLIVAADTQIVYCGFMYDNKNDGGNKYDTMFKYTNDTLLTNLDETFKATFGAPLDKKELFIDSISYGNKCGCAGIRPFGRVQMERWVSVSDTTHLTQWLLSANTEKQLYALDGLDRLKKKGILPSKQTLKVIQYVMYKKGSVLNCSMCNYSHTEIGTITVGFNF